MTSSRFKSKTPWRDKVNKPQEIRIVDIPPAWEKRMGVGKMLISTPRQIEQWLSRIPKGKLITLTTLRKKLADEAGVQDTCPLTTGIFLRIVAEAAEEDGYAGIDIAVPYWRVVKDKGRLNDKLPGGEVLQAEKLMQEGHHVRQNRSQSWFVQLTPDNTWLP